MINVTQKVPDYSTHIKEGTGIERVVLLFCILFFFIQITAEFFLSKAAIPKESKLSVLPENILSVSLVTDGEGKRDLNSFDWINSQDNFHFSPFFFQPIPINYCNKSLLMSIKGIGPSLAENILQTRNDIGGFSGPGDLLKINGVGPGRLEKFKSSFSFSQDNDQK